MMMEHNLKPCPLCGGKISLEAVCQTPQERRVHMRCGCCGMEFIHKQDFVCGKYARMAIGRSFEDIWNGRADHETV
jgi:hypothetical protein